MDPVINCAMSPLLDKPSSTRPIEIQHSCD
jgi:hypothetical protein